MGEWTRKQFMKTHLFVCDFGLIHHRGDWAILCGRTKSQSSLGIVLVFIFYCVARLPTWRKLLVDMCGPTEPSRKETKKMSMQHRRAWTRAVYFFSLLRCSSRKATLIFLSAVQTKYWYKHLIFTTIRIHSRTIYPGIFFRLFPVFNISMSFKFPPSVLQNLQYYLVKWVNCRDEKYIVV